MRRGGGWKQEEEMEGSAVKIKCEEVDGKGVGRIGAGTIETGEKL